MSVTGAIIAGVGAAGSLGGAAIASHGANTAAKTQADAALQAAQLQHVDANAALDFNKQVYGTQQQQIAPYLAVGQSGLSNLARLAGLFPEVSPGAPAAAAPGTGATSLPAAPSDPFADYTAKYNGQDFRSLVNSGDPLLSPNAETTRSWENSGIPYRNIMSSDGRAVAVRTDQIPQSSAPSSLPSTTDSLSSLQGLANPALGDPGSLLKPYPDKFVAPDSVTEQNDPGYQFRMSEGLKAIENSAAARGGLLSGGTAKALTDWAQNDASNEYSNVYNRAQSTFGTNYNVFQNNQSNTFNRLAALAGIGQASTAQLANSGNAAAGNASTILLNSGQQIGNSIQNAGSARATGYLNAGNNYGTALSGLGGSLTNLWMLSKMFPSTTGGGGSVTSFPGA